MELGSCLHPTLHPTPGFTIFSQWLVPVLFSCVFSRDIWSQEIGITRCWELRFPLPYRSAWGRGDCAGTGQELLLRFPHPTELFENRKSFFFFFFPLPLWLITRYIVPCAVQWHLSVYPSHVCLYLIIPNSQSFPSPQAATSLLCLFLRYSFVLCFRVLIVTSGPWCSGHMHVGPEPSKRKALRPERTQALHWGGVDFLSLGPK